MSPEAPGYIDAYDTLGMRLSQVEGVLESLMVNYTQQRVDKMVHLLSPGVTLDALSAARELLTQAIVASEALDPR